MISKRFLWLTSAAAVVAAFGVLAGCAGSSSGVTQNPVNVNGGLGTQNGGTAAAAANVPAAGGATGQVNMTNPDGTVSTVTATYPSLPGGAYNFPAGGNLGVLPAGQTPLAGAYPSAPNNNVTVNGITNSGVTVGTDGLLPSFIALPVAGDASQPAGSAANPGSAYTIELPSAALSSRVLHIGSVSFSGTFYLFLSGGNLKLISPVPTDIQGSLPNDGENASGHSVTTTFGAGNAGRTATLDVIYGNGFTLHQTKTIPTSLSVTFNNFTTDSSNVPNNGVQKVSFSIGDL